MPKHLKRAMPRNVPKMHVTGLTPAFLMSSLCEGWDRRGRGAPGRLPKEARLGEEADLFPGRSQATHCPSPGCSGLGSSGGLLGSDLQ